MFDFLGIVGLLGFIVFLVLGIVSAIKRNGKAKKRLLISVILLVIGFIGILNAPTSDSSEDQAKSDEKEKTNKVVVKEEETKILPSTVADVQSLVRVDMTEKEYAKAKRQLNVEFPESLSIGNGNVGRVLEATDGLVLVGTNGKKVLFVETFKTMDEAKAYAKDLYDNAEKEKAEADKKAYNDAKIKISGSGDTATDMIELKAGYILVEGSHSGTSNFAVTLQDESGRDLELLVNEVGNYKGTTYAEIPTDGKYYFNVIASGSWKLDLSQQPPLDIKDLPNQFSGNGDDVFFFNAKSGNYKFSFTHSGASNFAVKLNGSGLMVNEIGNYNGSMRQVLSTDGNYLMVMVADGDWTANIEK